MTRRPSTIIAPLVLGAASAWVAYAGIPHLLGLRCPRKGRDTGYRLALSFDDGPDPEWTPRVLDILAGRRVRASFFLVGNRAARAAATVRAIVTAGHEIGNHGWSHRCLWFCGPRRTALEIGRAHEVLARLAGRPPRLFRPPWGMVNAATFPVLRRYDERPVFWSIQPEGLRRVPPTRQVRHVIERAHPGAIVDLHDGEGTPNAPARLCAALPAMIDGLRDAGFTLVPVGELLE